MFDSRKLKLDLIINANSFANESIFVTLPISLIIEVALLRLLKFVWLIFKPIPITEFIKLFFFIFYHDVIWPCHTCMFYSVFF